MIPGTEQDFSNDLDLFSFLSTSKEWQGYSQNNDPSPKNYRERHSNQEKRVQLDEKRYNSTEKPNEKVIFEQNYLDNSGEELSDKASSTRTYSDSSISDQIWKDIEDYCGTISISDDDSASLRSQEIHTPSLVDEYSDCDISPNSDLFSPGPFEEPLIKQILPPPYDTVINCSREIERPPPSYEEVCGNLLITRVQRHKNPRFENYSQSSDNTFSVGCEDLSLSSDQFPDYGIHSPQPKRSRAYGHYSSNYFSSSSHSTGDGSAFPKEVPSKTNESSSSFPPSILFDSDELSMLGGVVNCNEVLKHKSSNDEFSCPRATESAVGPVSPMDPPPSYLTHHSSSFEESETPSDENRKGKITGLQRMALDAIFSVIDRPSRGLVTHIASELNLHHITVKNFFSNGRRRLRRAAARINDPERTRRENLRRKEKRRLAALAAAAAAFKQKEGASTTVAKEPIISPQRKALMEKLAVKIQKSAAQKTASKEPLEQCSIRNFQKRSAVHSSCTKKSFQTVTFPQREYNVEKRRRVSSYDSPYFGLYPSSKRLQECIDILTSDQDGPFSSSSLHSLVYS